MSKEQNFIDSSQPSKHEVVGTNTIMLTYHWRTEENKSIFLYITFNLKDGDTGPYLFVRSNFDSSEVRGQGKHLLNFYEKTLQETTSSGLKDMPPMPILAEISPNEYSLSLFKDNPHYQLRNDKYYRLYPVNND